MIIEEKGLPLNNNLNGNLILSFNLLSHNRFKLKDNNLHLSMDITLKESLVGFIKGITQLDGRLITINSDNIIKPNTVKSIENEGMYDLDNGYYGNLFLKFKIVYPNSLTNEQLKFIKEYF